METGTQPPVPSVVEVEQHLRQLNDEWVKALVRGDTATLDRVMADDFYFTYPLEGDDKAQFISDVTSGNLKVAHLTRGHVGVRVFDKTAVLTARDSATWIYQGRELMGQYKVIVVFAERGGSWQMCALQACPMQ